MTNHTSPNHQPKEVKQHAGVVRGLDNDDNLNNRAFILVTAFVFFVI